MMRLLFSIALVGLVACGGSSSTVDDLSTKKTDAAVDQAVATTTGDMAFFSACGHPGDVGNSKGVGKFCGTNGEVDCASQTFANICSSLGNNAATPTEDSYFCTSTCTATSPAGYCGENAACVCQTQGCGCIPAACVPADLGT